MMMDDEMVNFIKAQVRRAKDNQVVMSTANKEQVKYWEGYEDAMKFLINM